MSRSLGWIIGWSLIAAIALAGLIIWVSGTYAHDHWINRHRFTDPMSGAWCCNINDCEKITDKFGVIEQTNGYLISQSGEVISKKRVIWKSQDEFWWWCRPFHNGKPGLTRCLIGPPPGS